MNDTITPVRRRGDRMRISRSRGAASGFLLIILGVWGAAIPFVGPHLDFAFTPDQPWAWTTGRGWLEVLPGVAAVLGGLLLIRSRNRATAMFGGWLTVLAGAWFVLGRLFAPLLTVGTIGTPVAVTDQKRIALELSYFYGLGALIVFLGAVALGRVSVRSVRDVAYVDRPAAVVEPEPVASDEVTEIQPVPEESTERRRSLAGIFHRRRTSVPH